MPGLSPCNKVVASVIIASIVIVVLETEPRFYLAYQREFIIADIIISWLFAIEYAFRLWVMGEDPRYRGFEGRIKYMFTLRSVFDLLAILPIFFYGAVGSDMVIFRLFRLVRIYTLAKLGSFSIALKHIKHAVTERSNELILAFAMAMMVLLVASTIMYLIEGPLQPDKFGSIPRSLWWGISTLTGTGVGDIYPITVAGKICCSFTLLAGIGLIAMPTGILAAAFSDAFQRHKSSFAHKSLHPRQKP